MTKQILRRVGHNLFFKDPEMDVYFTWALGFTSVVGAYTGECFRMAMLIQDGDPLSWVTAWCDTASRIKKEAEKAEALCQTRTAREAYLRAYNYFRTANLLVSPGDRSYKEIWEQGVESFSCATRLFSYPIERFEVPFNGKTLPGYYVRAEENDKNRPTLLVIGGSETQVEDLYFWVGNSGAQSGFDILMVDLPGQGGTPLQGLFADWDVEKPIQRILDYTFDHFPIDENRFSIYGLSAGGYSVTKAATFDDRIKACIANAPFANVWRFYEKLVPSIFWDLPQSMQRGIINRLLTSSSIRKIQFEKQLWKSGSEDILASLKKLRESNFEDRLQLIKCPMLCLVGESDDKTMLDQCMRVYKAVSGPKTLRVFTVEEGADAHCQINNVALAQRVVFDWLERSL